MSSTPKQEGSQSPLTQGIRGTVGTVLDLLLGTKFHDQIHSD